jgi:TonB family protein
MPTTQIPPDSPVAAPAAARPEGGDLYDGQRWESVYQDLHATPALLIQLQDDLARARRREALWMSVVVHLLIIILIVNSPKLGGMFPKRTVFVVPANDWMRQKELTYLELPPDEQKVAKPPDSNIISDKDRIATSRIPRPDPKELKKILDSARAGRPGEPNPPGQETQPASPPAAAGQNSQQPEGLQAPPSSNQTAQLQMPPRPGTKPTFNTSPLSPGSAIAQATRAAAANRGGYGGERGDFGLGQGQRGQALGNLDILSDTRGVDFGPYLNRILHAVRENWYLHIPESVRDGKKGKLAIEFAILKDGSIAGLQLTDSSGDIPLDRAAWAGITDSNPFPPLPTEFPGQYLSLRFRFYYNPDQSDLQ